MKTLDELKKDFIADVRGAAKPVRAWACGLEYEVFGFERDTRHRLRPSRVVDVVKRFSRNENDLTREGERITGVRLASGYVTIEPGGQIEFSSAAHKSLIEVENELTSFLKRLREIGREENAIFIALGFDPLRSGEEQFWFPKNRYAVMRPFLERRGRRGADMMTRTCAVQASFDFSDEADLTCKIETATRLAPIVSACFANSPFINGKLSNYKSLRLATWLETDAARTGGVPCIYDEGFTIRGFVDYAGGVPLMFVRRADDYLTNDEIMDARVSFADYACGTSSLAASLAGEFRFTDWHNHLSTLFNDVRLKNYLELRMCDCVDATNALAFAAMWKGLLYDADALFEASKIAPRWRREDALGLQKEVARHGLAARFGAVKVLPLAKELVRLSAAGLQRIAQDEVALLDDLKERVIEREVCPADLLIESWNKHRRLEQVCEEAAI